MCTDKFLWMRLFCVVILVLLVACEPEPEPTSMPSSGSGSSSQEDTLPDLVIVSADLQKQDLDERIYTLNLMIENNGASTPNTFRTQCFWECDSPRGNMHLVEHRSESGLEGGGSPRMATIRGFDIACEPLPSTLRFECMIDVGERIREEDEDNNTWRGSLGVPVVP